MPLLILTYFLANLLTVAFVWFDIFLWRGWYFHKDLFSNYDHNYAQRCLVGAIVITAYLLIGKSIIRLLFSKRHKDADEPRTQRLQEQQRIHRPDGSIIHVEHGGIKGKQTIVFIHGWNSNSMQWYYQQKYFGTSYHLLLMDHAGLGKSRRPANGDYSLEKLAGDLDAVIEQSDVRDPILWGHSMGGFTILTYCKEFPHKLAKIKGLILEHTTYTNPVKTSILSSLLTALQNPVLKPMCWLMIMFSPVLWLSRWMSYFNGNSLLMTRFMTFAGTQTAKQLDFTAFLSTLAPPSVTARGVLGMFNYDATKVLEKVPVPTLVIGAENDRLTKMEASLTMHSRIPQAKLVKLMPAGHMGFVERHQEVNKAVAGFLSAINVIG